jgi:hypothetical protein
MRINRALLISASLLVGAAMQSSGQNAAQALTISLTVYDQSTPQSVKPIRITSKDLIRLFAGTNVARGQLFLITPLASGALTNTGNLNAFLRVTQGASPTNTIVEAQTPDSFNFFQDAIVTTTHNTSITSIGIDRFSIAYGDLQAELQGSSAWNYHQRFARGTPPTGISAFTMNAVSGTGTIVNVTQNWVPIQGTIAAGTPVMVDF